MGLTAVLVISVALLVTGIFLYVRRKQVLKERRGDDCDRGHRAVLLELGDDVIWELGQHGKAPLGLTQNESPGLTRRRFFPRFTMSVVGVFVGSLATRGANPKLLGRWLTRFPDQRSSYGPAAGSGGEEYRLASGHTDIPHTDSHTDLPHADSHTDSPHTDTHYDSPEKRVSVTDPWGNHVDVLKPHADSHLDVLAVDTHEDTPHTDDHTDVPHTDDAEREEA